MAAFAKGLDKDVDVHINCVNEFENVFMVVTRPDIDHGWSPFVVDIVDKKREDMNIRIYQMHD